MAEPTRNNAHIRRGRTKRQSPEVQAAEAAQFLNDPAYLRGFDATHNGIVKLICETKSDGSPEFEDAEREMCRSLRTLHGLKQIITKSVGMQKLRLADFQAGKPEDDKGAA